MYKVQNRIDHSPRNPSDLSNPMNIGMCESVVDGFEVRRGGKITGGTLERKEISRRGNDVRVIPAAWGGRVT